MTDVLKDRVAAVMNDDGADKYGKKGHTAAVLAEIVSEVKKLPNAPAGGGKTQPAPNAPAGGGETQPSLTQLIANDMRHLVVQEAYDLAEGIMRVHKPDSKDDQLKTETIELMLTLNKWCRQIT